MVNLVPVDLAAGREAVEALALEGEGLDERELSRLTGEFDDAPIAHRVDILLKDKIDHPALLEHIERVGRVFYERG